MPCLEALAEHRPCLDVRLSHGVHLDAVAGGVGMRDAITQLMKLMVLALLDLDEQSSKRRGATRGKEHGELERLGAEDMALDQIVVARSGR